MKLIAVALLTIASLTGVATAEVKTPPKPPDKVQDIPQYQQERFSFMYGVVVALYDAGATGLCDDLFILEQKADQAGYKEPLVITKQLTDIRKSCFTPSPEANK